ncbi:MAG: cytochrome c family protein [Rhodospirillales bacterium]|nr:cytochrome c family protein [Alphaproteobacteria bacterium]MCB9986917.1 cytochrome c family protein [Rhodospirillales bacterium]USO08307.1 MAG: cytochrome c family protein [Rhodospirillales bacterium]
MSGKISKVFAALLIAGAVAVTSNFVAHKVMAVEPLKQNAYKIEVAQADTTSAAPAAPATDAAPAVPATEAAPAAAAPEGAEPILGLLKSADAAKGQTIAKACAACHSFGKGEPARVGPNLYGIVGNKHAHMEGFAYSSAMKGLHDQTWTYEALNAFLWNPKKDIAGTKMTFAGLKNPEQRADVIAYLRTLSDSPAPLPTDAEIAAEGKK